MASFQEQDNAAAEVEDVIDEEESVKKEEPAEAPKAVKTIMDDEEPVEEVAVAALYHEGKLVDSDDEDEDQGETESPTMERTEDTPFYLSELEPSTGLVELDDDDDDDHNRE